MTPQAKRSYSYQPTLADWEEVERDADYIVSNIGIPDVVINSAGAGEWLSLNETTMEHFNETINSPYLAAAHTCKAFFDRMLKRGRGQFIIINSAACYFSFPGATGYTSARWALLGLSRSLQADLRTTNFGVNMLAFGKVKTPYFTNNPISEERIPKIVDQLIPTLSETEAAQIICRNLFVKNKEFIFPWQMRISVILNRWFPGVFKVLMQ